MRYLELVENNINRNQFLEALDLWVDGIGQNIKIDQNKRTKIANIIKKGIKEFRTTEKKLYRAEKISSVQLQELQKGKSIILPPSGARSYSPSLEIAKWWYNEYQSPETILYWITPDSNTVDINQVKKTLTNEELKSLEVIPYNNDPEVVVFDSRNNNLVSPEQVIVPEQ